MHRPLVLWGQNVVINHPCSIEDLPPIKGVILSHNHYDHLDKAAIKSLAQKVEQFYMLLGVGRNLKKWGIDGAKINEFDWFEGVKIGSVKLTLTPAQHFSGRGLGDGNKTLWGAVG